jgi:GT2 family glycosyltransferase
LSPETALAVVVVTHDSAKSLPFVLEAALTQLAAGDELVVVDNASADDTVAVARAAGDRIRVIQNSRNLGFGGGCHVGVRATTAQLVLFLNPDCRLEAECLDQLRHAAAENPDWGAWQAVVLLPDGHINTDGGVVHFVGIGWAGDCGKPIAAAPTAPGPVAFPSGAAMTVRREAWERLGGFDPAYFMYSEDLDLGLRLWLSGYGVGVVPGARVIHEYEFDKGMRKWFWLERNRWRTVLSVYPTLLLLLIMPALIATELALLAVAAREGWLSAKLRSQGSVLFGLPSTLRRRRAVQAQRSIGVATFSAHLTASLDTPYLPLSVNSRAARLQAAYWRLVQRLLSLAAR